MSDDIINPPVTRDTRVVPVDPKNSDAQIRFEEFLFGAETRFASPITGVELRSLVDLMGQLIEGQRLTNMILNRLIAETLTLDDLEDS